MRQITTLLLTLFLLGCRSLNPVAPDPEIRLDLSPAFDDSESQSVAPTGKYLNWGYYRLTIARDGSYAELVPSRSSQYDYYTYGHHINALKLLEGSPCSNCVSVSNVHLLPDGNLSVDVSITHPFHNPVYTGFDVRGIIMFPASQHLPDDELRAEAGLGPYTGAGLTIFSSSKKGDAELVNREGWTKIWNPVDGFGFWTEIGTGFPIFDYYQGKFASGENIGTLNPYIRFHSNETRHMFEVNKTVTRTYIIKPPAEGPIEACYAVYAHWAQPDVTPVTNPAADFPLIANSCMPYELEFFQDGVIDPDAPFDVQAKHIRIHMKHWGVIPLEIDTYDYWEMTQCDFVDFSTATQFRPHWSGEADTYGPEIFDAWDYCTYLPNHFPGTLPVIFHVEIDDPIKPFGIGDVGAEWWIMDVQFGALDGQW